MNATRQDSDVTKQENKNYKTLFTTEETNGCIAFKSDWIVAELEISQ